MKPWSGTIAVEGRPTDDGRMLTPGAVTWGDLPRPLLNPDTGLALGQVDTITREGDLLRATGSWTEEDEEVGLAIALVSAEADFQGVGAVMVVTAGVIQGVYVSESPAWPECRMDPAEPTA
ncbi:hypothetical protein QDA01_gp35 [Microbacterium phage Cinna]|uniref:Uncharacterized protein n=1 Tax=Microbacterium phage Cinna TaxID=2591215 RepID=A0A514DDH5_9CAUD|nr:hypothetical protein QDA01_gp35 [Microbacterium phage Cinna]QDH91654.1 hypothetical protein PBI_CINNA_70 [Microbacterium phage Cinna]